MESGLPIRPLEPPLHSSGNKRTGARSRVSVIVLLGRSRAVDGHCQHWPTVPRPAQRRRERMR